MATDWQGVLGFSTNDLQDLRYVACAYVKEGKYQIALSYFQALSVLEQNPFDRKMLGALYLQLGDNEKALDSLERAQSLDPSDEQVKLNRAKALFLLGMRDFALELCNQLKDAEDKTTSDLAQALILAYS